MDNWALATIVVLLGAAFTEASVSIISQKVEIFDKDLVQENIKVAEGDDGSIFLDGTITTTKPIDDEYTLTGTIFKNPGNIKLFSMTKNTEEIMNGIYKESFMEIFHKCSDLPYFEDKWEPPFPAQTYKFDKCTVPNTESYSKGMAPGQFKVVIEGKKGEETIGVMEVEVENKK
ncbi:hypothetical protein ACFFRR_009231 [Megaselia abdita]